MKLLVPIALLSVVALGSACASIIGLNGEPMLADGGIGADGQGGDGGTCSIDCLGGACVDGMCQPVVVASNQGGPIFIAQFGSQIFWTNLTGGTVGFADKIDGSAGIFGSAADSPFGIGADDSGVYVANSGLSGTVWRCDYTGCGATSTIFDAGFTNTDLAVLSGYVYWLQADGDELDRMKEPGTAFQTITSTDTNNFDDLLARITTDGTSVYWSETFNDTVLSKTIGSPTSKTIFTLPTNSAPSAIHYDDGVLYFATFGQNNGTGTVFYGMPDGSGGPQTLAASQHYPYAIATDDTYVYWTTEGDVPADGGVYTNGGVFRCAKAGCNGNPDQLASGLSDARGIVADDTALYFVTFETGSGDGKVWRLAK